MSPKEFLLEKQPRTDVERIACLAFYLTHYRDTPHFKTLELSKLNTEAAQQKFANAANATEQRSQDGLSRAIVEGSAATWRRRRNVRSARFRIAIQHEPL